MAETLEITTNFLLPAFNVSLQQCASLTSARARRLSATGVPSVRSLRPPSFAEHVVGFQLELLTQCEGFTSLPDDPSWRDMAHSMGQRNLFVAHRTPSEITDDTERSVIAELRRKFKALLASATQLRLQAASTRSGLQNVVGTMRLWHAWYVSETLEAFARYPGNTAHCLDPEFGCGVYMWRVLAVAIPGDIARFVHTEPETNAAVKAWQNQSNVRPELRRRTGCNGVRLEICLHYLGGAARNRIPRIPALERALTSLPCHQADSGAMVWDEAARFAAWKARLGIPLFFTCDSRACCTTLCKHGLGKFIASTNHIGARSILQKPIQHTCGCAVQAERALAVLMATHPRLGAGAPLSALLDDTLCDIVARCDVVHDGSGLHALQTAAAAAPRPHARTEPRLLAIFRLLFLRQGGAVLDT